MCFQPGFIKWLENFQPDALIIEANPRYLSTSSAIRWMKSKHKPVIGWGLGAPPMHGLFSNYRSQSRKKFLNQLDAMIAYSQQGAGTVCSLRIPKVKYFYSSKFCCFQTLVTSSR